MKEKMLVMRDWFDQCELLPVENRQEVYYAVLRYGLYGEEPDTGNIMMDVAIKQITSQVDRMNEGYAQFIEAGKTGGRRKLVDDSAIFKLAREGKSGKEIGEELGINPKTIYSSAGWKQAKLRD